MERLTSSIPPPDGRLDMGKGRQRNHETPRFLLNRFASRVEGSKRWVWRIGRDGSVHELSTRNVAVSRRFYDAGVEDALAIAEGRFSKLLASIDSGSPPQAFSEELRQLIWTLAARTRAFRRQWAAAANGLLSEFGVFSQTADAQDAVVRQLYSSIDEYVEGSLDSLPPEHRRLVSEFVSVPANREQLVKYVGSNFGSVAGALVRILQDRRIMQSSAKVGQIKGLAKALDQRTPRDAGFFKPGAWHVMLADPHTFLLGDGCVFAKRGDGDLCSLFKAGKHWSEAYLPISDRQVLVATRDRDRPSPNEPSRSIRPQRRSLLNTSTLQIRPLATLAR